MNRVKVSPVVESEARKSAAGLSTRLPRTINQPHPALNAPNSIGDSRWELFSPLPSQQSISRSTVLAITGTMALSKSSTLLGFRFQPKSGQMLALLFHYLFNFIFFWGGVCLFVWFSQQMSCKAACVSAACAWESWDGRKAAKSRILAVD